MSAFRSELLVLRKRMAAWILLAITCLLSLSFSYIFPYISYLGASDGEPAADDLPRLLPEQFVSTVVGVFPFYAGFMILILAVLAIGSEFNWETIKTTLMQQPNRLRLLMNKLAALGVAVIVFTVAVFIVGAIASTVIALVEGATLSYPAFGTLLRGLGAGLLILTLWVLLGIALSVLLRSTTMALGLGFLYTLVIEGVIAGFGIDIAFLGTISQGFIRTNTYSLIEPLLGPTLNVGGPGAFAGPFINPWQALAVIVGYIIAFTIIAGAFLRWRDLG